MMNPIICKQQTTEAKALMIWEEPLNLSYYKLQPTMTWIFLPVGILPCSRVHASLHWLLSRNINFSSCSVSCQAQRHNVLISIAATSHNPTHSIMGPDMEWCMGPWHSYMEFNVNHPLLIMSSFHFWNKQIMVYIKHYQSSDSYPPCS